MQNIKALKCTQELLDWKGLLTAHQCTIGKGEPSIYTVLGGGSLPEIQL